MKLRLKSKLHSPKAHDMPLAFNNLTIDILIHYLPDIQYACGWWITELPVSCIIDLFGQTFYM
jgi:hypothetical protein